MPAPGTSPDSDTAVSAERLRLVVGRLQRQLRQQATGDLTLTQASLLVSVERHGPVSLGDLAAHERLAPPSVTKITTKLEDLGLVERLPDPTNRRVTRLVLTGAGRRTLDTIRRRRSAWLTVRLGELSGDELRRLHDALEVLEHLAAIGAPEAATRVEAP